VHNPDEDTVEGSAEGIAEGNCEGFGEGSAKEHAPFRYEVSPEGDEYGVVPALMVYILEYGS